MASGSTISIGGAISYPPPPSRPVGYHRLRGPRKPGRVHVRSHSHSPLDCYPSSRFILLPINPAAQYLRSFRWNLAPRTIRIQHEHHRIGLTRREPSKPERVFHRGHDQALTPLPDHFGLEHRRQVTRTGNSARYVLGGPSVLYDQCPIAIAYGQDGEANHVYFDPDAPTTSSPGGAVQAPRLAMIRSIVPTRPRR